MSYLRYLCLLAYSVFVLHLFVFLPVSLDCSFMIATFGIL